MKKILVLVGLVGLAACGTTPDQQKQISCTLATTQAANVQALVKGAQTPSPDDLARLEAAQALATALCAAVVSK